MPIKAEFDPPFSTVYVREWVPDADPPDYADVAEYPCKAYQLSSSELNEQGRETSLDAFDVWVDLLPDRTSPIARDARVRIDEYGDMNIEGLTLFDDLDYKMVQLSCTRGE